MGHKLKSLIFFLLSVITANTSFAQTDGANMEVDYSNDGRGWVFGLNVGVYYASKETAAYHNGKSTNVNNVAYVMSNYYWYQDIFHALGAHDSISVSGLPENMHYKLAMQPGLYAQYCFSPTFALLIEFNYMKLKAEDVIIFEVDPPQDYLANPDLRLYPMRGAEERIYADIGVKRSYPKTDKLSYFWMGGLNVNSTQVKKSSFYVEEVEYSMINVYLDGGYVPNGNTQSYTVYQGGIGIGGFAGAGASLSFGNSIVIEPGFTAHWLMVKLEGYQNMNPGIGAYIRFLF
jgi:hypothetical protein